MDGYYFLSSSKKVIRYPGHHLQAPDLFLKQGDLSKQVIKISVNFFPVMILHLKSDSEKH